MQNNAGAGAGAPSGNQGQQPTGMMYQQAYGMPGQPGVAPGQMGGMDPVLSLIHI